jgi:hypothetical protein
MNNTGGPAFPRNILEHGHGVTTTHESGMTLRDYFAGQVAIGAMSEYWNGDRMTDPTFADIAKQAYGIADAMLKERKQK